MRKTGALRKAAECLDGAAGAERDTLEPGHGNAAWKMVTGNDDDGKRSQGDGGRVTGQVQRREERGERGEGKRGA